MQSDQWHPSDIDAAAAATEAANQAQAEAPAPKARTRSAEPVVEAPQAETPRKASSGVMTLDRDSASKTAAQDQATAEAAQANDIQTRYGETSQRVKDCLAHWKSGQDGEADLTNALHDLRRVLARIEIELASSHAGDASQKPIPIPLHRAHKGL